MYECLFLYSYSKHLSFMLKFFVFFYSQEQIQSIFNL